MRTPRAAFESRLDLLRTLIERSGGISARRLAEATGDSVSNIWKMLRHLRHEGSVYVSEDVEPPTLNKGPAARLLKIVPPAEVP